MQVTVKMLEEGADRIRRIKHGPQLIPAIGIKVSAAQLDKAAELLREAEPSVITAASGPVQVTLNKPQARPAYIEPTAQNPEKPEILVFQIGILGETYRIDREGNLRDG
jgi:hypothetical protein